MLVIALALIDDDDDRIKFEDLFSEHKKTMYFVAFEILSSKEDAEDAVNEAFIRVALNIRKVGEVQSHKTRGYLKRITSNAAIDIYNKRNRVQSISFESLQYEPPSLDDVEATVITNIQQKEILNSMATLPAIYRNVLMFRYVDQLNASEIAKQLSVSATTVRKRLQRGLEMLNIQLTGGDGNGKS